MVSMRIRIQGAKPIRTLVRLCRHKKLDFDMKNILCHKTYLRRYRIYFEGLESGVLLHLVNFLAPKSGSAFPIRIQIQIQESQINAGSCRSGSATLLFNKVFRHHIFVRYETERTDAPWIVQKNISRLAMKDFLFVLLWARWNTKVFLI